jgi:beta-glucosidase
MADVLSGKVNPSGKLPFTVAAKYEDYPSATNFPYSNGNVAEVCYDEDIFVGYRHFDTFGVEPLYPFGYGLSYTSFDYSDLTIRPSANGFDVTVTVKNTGKVAGRESVQIYVSAPSNPHMPKPAKELKAFGKTGLLKPGASETLRMHISRGQLASWNTLDGGWIVDSGAYTFMAGASSSNILLKETVQL